MRSLKFTGGRRWLGACAAVAAAVVLSSGALAAPSSAATLTVTKPCYVNAVAKGKLRRALMVVAGTGYVPGDAVYITSSDNTVFAHTAADAKGLILVVTGAPVPKLKRPGSKVSRLTARDSSGVTGMTSARSTILDVATVPAKAKPSRKVTWYFSGFTPGRFIYGHYLRGKHQVARARFGRAKGACGLLRVRTRFFPGRQRYTHYGLQFDDSKRYRRRSIPRIDTSLNVF